MTATAAQRQQVVEWGVASRALPGQVVSGDLHAVIPWSDGVDGLGHGDEATAAARAAVQVLERHPAESVVALVQRCHQALLLTRGVVMTLASISTRDDTLTAIGIGNVETML